MIQIVNSSAKHARKFLQIGNNKSKLEIEHKPNSFDYSFGIMNIKYYMK